MKDKVERQQLHVVVTPELHAALERKREEVRKQTGVSVTIPQLVRSILQESLEVEA